MSTTPPEGPAAGARPGLLRRLARMDGEELRTRLRQETEKRLDALRAWVRLPAAQPRRLAGEIEPGRFFFEPADIPLIVEQIRKRSPDASAILHAQAEKIVARRFDLLGYEDLDFGPEINWNFDPVSGKEAPRKPWPSVPYLSYEAVGDHKVTWELGRHQHLVVLARAWRLTGEDRFRREAIAQWRSWREASPYPWGIHWTSALEVAFRAISWMWLRGLFAGSGAEAAGFQRDLEDACGQAAYYLERYLSYYFSPNTHLLGEATALYALGQVFRGFEGAERWRETGRRVALEQAEKQIREDGLHFEQSLYYHVYALDFFLFFDLIAKRNSDSEGSKVEPVIERMAEMLFRLAQGGAAPRFGDDDGGRLFDPRRNRPEHMLDPLAACALLAARPDWKAAAGPLREETIWLLGTEGCRNWDALAGGASKPAARRHDAGGWHVLVSAEEPPRTLIFDAGPLGAMSGGHGHAAALSVQSYRNARAWLTDPGTGRYPQPTPERDAFRSTAAHSTLRVDGRDQATPTGSFSWDRLTRSNTELFLDGRMLDFAVARHDGYERLAGPVTHRRWALLLDHGLIVIRDVAAGSGRHRLEQTWRIGPEFRVRALGAAEVVFETADGEALACVSPQSSSWSRDISAGAWSPCYGVWQEAPVVRYAAEAELPAERTIAFAPGRAGEERSRALELLEDGRGEALSVYRYREAEATLTLCFSDKPGEWSYGTVRTDARLLAWEVGPRGRRLLAAFGTFLEADGEEVFRKAGVVECFEWNGGEGALGRLGTDL